MSGTASDPTADDMSDDISNGLRDDEPMQVDESASIEKPPETDMDKKPSKITKKLRKSRSSVSSEKSLKKENGKEGEVKRKLSESEIRSEENDFFGFSSPPDTSARDQFLQYLVKWNEASVDDDAQSQSDKTSADNADSDSTTENNSGKSAARLSTKSKLIELNNANFKKPFDAGWKREVVYRIGSSKKTTDVYYYTPTGDKVKSTKEVSEHLTGDLTVDSFTFAKEPIGINDPAKELIREAKTARTSEKQVNPTPKSKSKTVVEPSPKTTPKTLKRSNKKPLFPKKSEKVRKSVSGPELDDDSSDDADWESTQKNPTREVCSIECRLAMGLIPTLQCVSCLCLYHPECVGFQQDKLGPSKQYLCKNCQSTSSQQAAAKAASVAHPPPALIPLNPQPSGSSSRKTTISKSESKTTVNRQNIVGTVTTWLPSSSSIQISQSSPTPKTSTTSTTMTVTPTSSTKQPTPDGPRQGLLEIGGNSFVVIPRYNVVNVSNQSSSAPALAATASPLNPSPTQTNGILLVPLSVQPPDSTMVDVGKSSNAETNGQRTGESSVEEDSCQSKSSAKLKEVPAKYLAKDFFASCEATTLSMYNIFQYLKVHELLRATQVNKTWNFIATHQSLWETVRMKNSKVRDFEGFGSALRKYNTKSLDLRKMITPESPEATNEMWTKLGAVVSKLPNVRKVDFGRCTPSAIEVVAAACPHLESITSLSVRGNDLNMSLIANCQNLVELKIKGFGGIDIKNVRPLKQLTKLKTLVLTQVKNLEGIETSLPDSLENLELGECVKLTERFASLGLAKLVNLKRLRLERGQGCPTLAILNTLSNLPLLAQLELINFDIKPGFDKALSKCSNIKVLLIIPTYVTQSATTNHVVMGGVSKLCASLQYFIWGLTLELLRVTDLFIDQVEGTKGKSTSSLSASSKKASTGDSIPILKPLGEESSDSNREGSTSQVDILGLPKLQRVLSTLLPHTKIKILKIPFGATWRQTVTDSAV